VATVAEGDWTAEELNEDVAGWTTSGACDGEVLVRGLLTRAASLSAIALAQWDCGRLDDVGGLSPWVEWGR
jgi:hypothetical protein